MTKNMNYIYNYRSSSSMKKKLLVTHLLLFCFLILSTQSAFAGDPKKRFRYEKTGQVIWDINTKEKLVALTFDDGPHPVYTPQILDVLEKYHAKATFFVIGKHAESYPEIIKRQVKEGHEIANHTYRHYFRDNFDRERLKQELNKTSKVIHDLTGYTPTLFRPIAGYYDDQIINTAVTNGYRVILWSWHQDTKDWKQPGIRRITTEVLSDTRPGDVVIFHDSGGDRTQTVKAVEKILEALTKEGYKFVTVSEMLYRTEPIFSDPLNFLKK